MRALGLHLLHEIVLSWLQAVAHPGFGKGAGDTGVLVCSPHPLTNFYGFHMKKHSYQHTFFIKKGHAVSAVTMDNAKIFSQLTGVSKSRSLAKICERRLQSLLV